MSKPTVEDTRRLSGGFRDKTLQDRSSMHSNFGFVFAQVANQDAFTSWRQFKSQTVWHYGVGIVAFARDCHPFSSCGVSFDVESHLALKRPIPSAVQSVAGATILFTSATELNPLPSQHIDLFSEALETISFPRWRFGMQSLAAGKTYSVESAGFHAVTAGSCCISYVDGDCERQFDVRAGHGLLLTRDVRHSIQANRDSTRPTTIVFGLFEAAEKLQPLYSMIPAVSPVEWSSEFQFPYVSRLIGMLLDTHDVPLGGGAVTGLMYRAVLVSILRSLLVQRVQDSRFEDFSRTDWLSAFLDPFVGEALRAIHREPGLAWTVQGLASRSGISRSGFAARFRALLGKPPLQYVTEFRMKRACELLVAGSIDIQDVSLRLGYESASAFSTAFKRAHGISSGAYRANERRLQS
ncbi:MAG: AraC family transcriptional regulator [Planctomycetota bacterium]|nr:AraC family transcriptional regulator [Planctomycetota bacterium]